MESPVLDDSDVEDEEDAFRDVDLKRLSDQYVEYLKLIKDNWSSCHASKILTNNLIKYITPRFRQLSAPLRVRILTSFLYIKDTLRTECEKQLLKILHYVEVDSNEWVRKMGRLVRPYIKTGMIDLRLIDTETAFRIITFLDERLLESPEEGEYLRKPGIDNVHLCNPETFENVNTSTSKDDEYLLFTPRWNFDTLGNTIERRAIAQLKGTYTNIQ